jgi:hypothetical protein
MAVRDISNLDSVDSEKNSELHTALALQEQEEQELARGIRETAEKKRRRLLREGRLDARRVTNETFRWISDPRFHPSGDKIIATKWYTSSRSLGAGEGWQYDVPSLKDLSSSSSKHILPASGKQLVKRNLPLGWSAEQYGEQQIGPEQLLWKDNETLIYAKNVNGEVNGVFEYSGGTFIGLSSSVRSLICLLDVHTGIYAIFSRNLTSERDTLLVDKTPGGASRPEISRDKTTIAFVRRVRDKEALVVMWVPCLFPSRIRSNRHLRNLATGTIRHLWYGLTYDLTAVSAPMGTYPSFAFAPKDKAIIIWSSGHIYSVPLSRNDEGEIIAAGTPRPIPFRATIEKQLAETMHVDTDLVALETAPTQKLNAFRHLDADEKGKHVVFEGAGVTYIQSLSKGAKAKPVPTLDNAPVYYQPSFVPGYDNLVIHSHWSDSNFTTFEIANLTSGVAKAVAGALPRGRYFSPTVSGYTGDDKLLAFVKTGGDLLTGDIVATAGQGLYIADITIFPEFGPVEIKNIRFIPSEVSTWAPPKMRFIGQTRRLLVQEQSKAYIIDLGSPGDKDGKPKHTEIASARASMEIVTVATRRAAQSIAFVEYGYVYFISGKYLKKGKALWSKPANATKGLARVGINGGHDVQWSRDGSKLFWLLGQQDNSSEESIANLQYEQARICIRLKCQRSPSARRRFATIPLVLAFNA